MKRAEVYAGLPLQAEHPQFSTIVPAKAGTQ
jgi:hypothetical protein